MQPECVLIQRMGDLDTKRHVSQHVSLSTHYRSGQVLLNLLAGGALSCIGI